MSVAEKQQQVVAEFQAIPDWEERYKRIIALARGLPPMPEALKTEERKVRGCASTVWLHARTSGERVEYLADSDAVLVQGLIALLLRVYSGQRAEDIIASKPEFIEAIGLNTNLSPNRANGVSAMVLQIKKYAVEALTDIRRQRPTEITPRQNTRLADDPARKTTEITPARSQRLIDPDRKV